MKHKYNSYRKRAQLKSDINITPFVDVILVLLIVFMITAPMLITGLDVTLPDVSSTNEQSPDHITFITVRCDSTIYMDDKKLNINELEDVIRIKIRAKPDQSFIIRGDQNASYGTIAAIFASLSKNNVTAVALETEN